VKIYLHSDRAERLPTYTVHVAPAGDTGFIKAVDIREDWKLPDGNAKQFSIDFAYGAAEVEDSIARYMVDRGIAHKTRLLRQLRRLFTQDGTEIKEVFDERGARILFDGPAIAA
jgi:hypothetical protein